MKQQLLCQDPAHIDKALTYLADPDRVAKPAPNPFFHDMRLGHQNG